jgi:hypothetical protein
MALLLAAGVGVLERWANQRKGPALAELSARLGRPVSAGRLQLGILGGLRVELPDVVVGRDPRLPGEPDPVLRVPRARVRVAVFPALLSLGRRIRVKEISVEGLAAEVVRLPDGRLNWQDIADRLAPPGAEPGRGPDRRAQHLHIREARLSDARVRFVDLARGGAAAEIAHLDLSARDVSPASPFEVQLSAALLSEAKNLDLHARFQPAEHPDQTLAPRLERLAVKLAPTALAPLAPFLGAMGARGLQDLAQGTLAADLTMAAPEEGPAALKGFASLAEARFSGGKPFSARLDADVRADPAAGNLEVSRFEAKIADMAVTAHGRLADLRSNPRFEGFTLESRGLDFSELHALYPALDRATGAVLRGPFSVQARGTGAGAQQRLTARADLSGASLDVPGGLHKPAGTPLVLDALASAAGSTVRFERVSLAVAGWQVEGQGRLETSGRGDRAIRAFDATVEAPVVPLRELGALLLPRRAAALPDVRVGGRAHASGRLGQPETLAVELPAFSVTGAGTDLDGRMTLANLRAPRVSLEANARALDLDDLLPPRASAAAPPGPRSPAARPPWLAQASGTARLEIARGRAEGVDFQGLRAELDLQRGRLRARTLEGNAFGGRFSCAGSELPLADPDGAFVARGRVIGLDVAGLLARFAAGSQILAGRLDATLDLRGRAAEVRRTLTGTVSGQVAQAEYLPASLLEAIAGSVAGALDIPGLARLLGSATGTSPLLRDRRLGNLGGAARIAAGAATISAPLRSQTPAGPLAVTGQVGLDGAADLHGELALAPEVAAELTAGRAHPAHPIPVKLRITGALAHPQIRLEDPAAVARALASAFTPGEAVPAPGRVGRRPPREVPRPLEDEARRRLERLFKR